ncbi:hypothetical protein ISX56_33620 [Serratia ureilytica]|nr:hypothetical protein [Serratia ureilytica]
MMIDFALVSSTRKARGEGKTERDRAKKGGQRTLRDNGNAGRGKRRRRQTAGQLRAGQRLPQAG